MIPTLTLPFDIEGVFSHGSRYYVPMQRRTAIVLAFAACSIFPSFLAGSDELNQRLKRIFDSNAFAGKRFGPARWIRGGAAFTMLEDAPSTAGAKDGAKDIVEYDTATGKRAILVSHVAKVLRMMSGSVPSLIPRFPASVGNCTFISIRMICLDFVGSNSVRVSRAQRCRDLNCLEGS